MAAYEPVRIDSTRVVDEQREPLFYIDDQEYTIPKEVRANVVARYLQDTLDHGQEHAIAAAMREVLGGEAMEALAASDAVTADQMQQIMGIVEDKLVGQMKRSLGNSRNGRRR